MRAVYLCRICGVMFPVVVTREAGAVAAHNQTWHHPDCIVPFDGTNKRPLYAIADLVADDDYGVQEPA